MTKRRDRRKRHSGENVTADAGVQQGDTLRLVLGAHGQDGLATANWKGAEVAVVGGIEGEVSQVVVRRVFPDRIIAEATLAEKPSPHRVEAPCGYFGDCGGCQWQHISYDKQLEMKRDILRRELERYAALRGIDVLETMQSPKRFGYRNHARFTVGKKGENRGKLGFMNPHTRQFVPIEKCLLMEEKINATLAELNSNGLEGGSQLSIRVGSNTGDGLIQPLLKQLPDIESGQPYYRETIGENNFKVASPSFFQVNTPQLERMADEIIGLLNLTGAERVVDAYCGTGALSVLVAPHAKEVVGIEDSASAVADARENGSHLENLRFIHGRAEAVLGELDGAAIDRIILDPPRSGCHPETLESVVKAAPARVVLVSCSPETFARDSAHLTARGFNLELVRPIDMFPQTRHVEAVGAFSL